MAWRFNAPPGWPPPVPGWLPPAGWAPDPAWPAPPPGWAFYVEEPPARGPVPGTPGVTATTFVLAIVGGVAWLSLSLVAALVAFVAISVPDGGDGTPGAMGRPACPLRPSVNATVDRVAFSPDGRTLATSGSIGFTPEPSHGARVSLCDVTTGEITHTLIGHVQFVNGLAFSPDGATLATTGDDTVRLWDVRTGAATATLAGITSSPPQDVAFSPDGRTLVVTGHETARLVDVASREPAITLAGPPGGIGRAAFSPDGRTVATAGDDGVVRLWDPRTGAEVTTLTGHADAVQDLDFSPDGTMLATACADGTARLWALAGGKEPVVLPDLASSGRDPRTAREAQVSAVRFSPDGGTVATGNGQGLVHVWDLTGHLETTVTGRFETWDSFVDGYSSDGEVTDLAYSPDGRDLAIADTSDTVRLWRVTTT